MFFRSKFLFLAPFIIGLGFWNTASAEVTDLVYGESSVVRVGEWNVSNALTTQKYVVPHGCPLVVPSPYPGRTRVASPIFGFSSRPSSVVVEPTSDVEAIVRTPLAGDRNVPFKEDWQFQAFRGAGKYETKFAFDFSSPGYLLWLTEDIYVPLPGDTDGDGKVLTNDYATFRKNFEQSVSCRDTAPWRRGDFNADNKIDMADFALLSANFGKTNGPVLPVVDTPDCRIRFATGSCNRSNSAPEISNAALYTLNAGQYSQSPAAEVLKLKRDGTQRYIIPHATIIDRDGDLPSFTLSLYNGSGMPVTLSNQTDYRAYTGKNADGSRYWYAVVRADESYNTGLLTLTVADPYTSKVQYYRWQFVN